jgi:hypothetical protein
MIGVRGPFQCDGESKLERHVKARRGRRLSIKLYPREIVDGVLRLVNQRENAVEAALAEGYFESRAWGKSIGADGGNVGEKKILKSCVVGHIQKN